MTEVSICGIRVKILFQVTTQTQIKTTVSISLWGEITCCKTTLTRTIIMVSISINREITDYETTLYRAIIMEFIRFHHWLDLTTLSTRIILLIIKRTSIVGPVFRRYLK